MTVGSPAGRKNQSYILVSFEHPGGGQKSVSVAVVQCKLLSEAQSHCFRSQTSLWSKTGKFLSSSYGNLDDSQYGKLVQWYLKAFWNFNFMCIHIPFMMKATRHWRPHFPMTHLEMFIKHMESGRPWSLWVLNDSDTYT